VKDHKGAWNKFVNESFETVERLAADFVQGKAEVDPCNKSACNYCKIGPLCRVGTAASEDEDDE
jgi:hypothetical protein